VRSPCYIRICVSVSVCQFVNLYHYSWNLVCIYHATWSHFKSSFPSSVIPILQPLTFFRQNLNIVWTPIPIFINLCMHISCHWGHPNGIHHKYLSSVIPTLHSLLNCWGNTFNIIKMPQPIVLSLGRYIMSSEAVLHKPLLATIPTLQPPKLYCFINFIAHICILKFSFHLSC
jgi:hypothetical protein